MWNDDFDNGIRNTIGEWLVWPVLFAFLWLAFMVLC